MDPLDFLPDELKKQIIDGLIGFLSRQAEKVVGDQVADGIRKLSSEGAFLDAFDKAMKNAMHRFASEYVIVDEDLVAAIAADTDFWKSAAVRKALANLVSHPGGWFESDRQVVMQHFEDVLPQRINRERVDKAVMALLRYIAEELWTLPGAKEVREVYRFQMEKISAEVLQKQVALQEAQLRATVQLSQDVRQALLELASALERKALANPPLPTVLPRPRPYHNLPRPDYSRFVGREWAMEWLRQRLSPNDRAWQIALIGIGGVGKSALAIAIAREYQRRYQELPEEERFEAIVWSSAKEEVLTIQGRERADLPGQVMHSLEDVYNAIARALDREDITRALPEDQTRLAHRVLSGQRTLLIMDNLESVTDERLRPFLRNLPPPTKVIITSREWVDVADVLPLTGLSQEESVSLISDEAQIRHVRLDPRQSQRIIDLTAGLPLPIKLSVARIASGEVFEAVTRWLGNASGDVPEYCVKGQVDLALTRDPAARDLLLACSLFDRAVGASREALGYIVDLSHVDRDRGLAQLQKLCLVNRSETDRFWMLPIVQRYAAAQLEQVPDTGAMIDRWLTWLVDFGKSNGVDLELHFETAPSFSLEYPNLINAIRWCDGHERWSTLLNLTEGAYFYPYLAGLFGDMEEILKTAIKAARNVQDEQAEGRMHSRLGRLRRTQGYYADARFHLKEAERIAYQYHNKLELGRIWHTYADVLWYLGSRTEAEEFARRALEIGERFGDLELKAETALRLSKMAIDRRHYVEATEWLDKAEQWATSLGSKRRLTWVAYRRGINLIEQSRFVEAEPYLVQSLEMATASGEFRMIGFIKNGLARVYVGTGRVDMARRTAEEGRELLDRTGTAYTEVDLEQLLQNASAISEQ